MLVSSGSGRRAVADLAVALGVAAVTGLGSVLLTYSEWLQNWFGYVSGLPLTGVILNILLFWLTVLLVLAFRRWRQAMRVQGELQDIISSISPDTLLVVSPERMIRTCNASVIRMFGYEQAEVVGQLTDLLYYDRRTRRDKPHEIYEALERDGFHVGYAKGRRRDGQEFPLEIIAAELTGRRGAVMLLRDITERERAAEQHRLLEERLRLQQKMESLGMLAGGVAHDFNNLLMVIQGNAEIISDAVQPDPVAVESQQAILQASDRAAALCRQMLAYAGDAAFSIEPVNLAELTGKTCRLLGVSLAHRVRLEVENGESTPLIRGDPVQLQQVVMNLVLNASEAIGGREGRILVRTGVRDFDAEFLQHCSLEPGLPQGRYVFLENRDDGCGMDAATRQRIFDPFFSTKRTGRGLGLATVMGIVRSHKGALHLETAPEKGSIFTLIFPCELSPPEAFAAAPELGGCGGESRSTAGAAG